VHAVAQSVRILLSSGVVAVERGTAPRITDMSWWKTALIYVAKKALQIAGEELGKKAAKK
jgi:hypothetical protein